MMDLWRSSTAPIEQGGIAHFKTNKRMDELCAMFKFLEAIATQASNLHQFQSHGLFLSELWKSKSKFCCYVFTSPECFCNAVSACCEVRPNEIISIAQVPVRFMMVQASSYVGFYLWWLMVVDGGWWWLMIILILKTVPELWPLAGLVQPHACPSAESARRPWAPT
jgi:hypothetical protein